MSFDLSATSTAGFRTSASIRDYTIEIDATGKASPDTQETLLAAYAACYVPALRVGADRLDIEPLGEIAIEVNAETGNDEKLTSIQFHVTVETSLTQDDREALIEEAASLCKVHAALREELTANVTITSSA